MAELINNSSERMEKLLAFSRELIITGTAKESFAAYQALIESVTAWDTMHVIDKLLQEDIPFEKIKANIGKLLNLFYKSLKSHEWEKPVEGHFLFYLMEENRAVEKIMEAIKKTLKTPSPDLLLAPQGGERVEHDFRKELLFLIDSLKLYELHYIKKENILFPYIEKTLQQFRCLTMMWSFHDDFRRLVKTIEGLLVTDNIDLPQLNKALGDLFFVVLPVIFREEQILFPVAYPSIPQKAWNDMLLQSGEIGWCYIDKPEIPNSKFQISDSSPDQTPLHASQRKCLTDCLIDLDTGFLTPSQLILLFENLPVDITFVDENDEVRYFSGAKHRIFPRSKAIIGRKVQNCHPPESVHIVNEIVAAFRNGSKDHADFWIRMKGRFIHIRYFALRDEQGIYKGTIEVSQDVTEIRSLEGERRLLEWQ